MLVMDCQSEELPPEGDVFSSLSSLEREQLRLKAAKETGAYHFLHHFASTFHLMGGITIAWMLGHYSWSVLYVPFLLLLLFKIDQRHSGKILQRLMRKLKNSQRESLVSFEREEVTWVNLYAIDFPLTKASWQKSFR